MARIAKLGQKNGYYFTKAGNPNGEYFGKVGEVSFDDANQAFRSYLAGIATVTKNRSGLTVRELIESFLEWAKAKRSARTLDERQRHLERFAYFPVGGVMMGDLAAGDVAAAHLEKFIDHIGKFNLVVIGDNAEWVKRDKRLDDFTAGKYGTSIQHAFAWGAGRSKNPTPCLPRSFHPFAGVERYKRPPEPLLESELIIPAEIAALMAHADDDIGLVIEPGRYRSRRSDEFRANNPYAGFRDLLTVFHETGARTSELADARVGQFVKSSKQVVLAKHKRSTTLRDSEARMITLADKSFDIVSRLCKGKKPNDPIFTTPKGGAWDRYSLCDRFSKVRAIAGVRDSITIYSFRHSWISEAMMAGISVATIAKMAGTSIAMIERVYGHFRNDHFADAQTRLTEARRIRALDAVA